MIKKYFVIAYLNLLSICCFAQTAANVPYFCGFEDEQENLNWVLNPASAAMQNNPNFVNKWGIGTAAAKQGYHSLYIYANGDLDVATYAEVIGYTFAYREFSLPVGEYDLTFNWRALGENNADEVVVYWLPVSAAANTYITANVTTNQPNTLLNTYKVSIGSAGANGLSGAASWQFAQATLRVIQPQNYRLVFCWRNNADNTYNPGGSIDNVQLNSKKTSSDCDRQPQNITANVQNSTLTVTWDAVAGAASYDLLYWLEGSGITDTVAGITSTTWSTVTTNMNTGRYTFYVRAVCADGSSSIFNEVSNVRIVGQTSDIADACPEVTFHETFYNTDGVKVIVPDCSDDGQFKIVPNLVGGGGSIAGYEVEEIPFNPPFPFNEGTPFQENGRWSDDIWGPIIDLPFSFCFFDGIYRQAQVGANGIVSFNANYLPGGRCEWDLRGQPDIPSKDFLYKNCIFGVYEDILPRNDLMHQNSGVFYGVLGEYPCRTLTVSWYDIPMFSCTSLFNTYQIVLYEGTNVIDVYVGERNLCTSWNNGIGIIGLINEDGTDGIAAPGRNTKDLWSVDKNQPEAWRFIPLTSSNYEITWYKGKGFDGQVLGKDEYLDIVRGDGIDTVTCRMQFTACNGDYFDIADTAVIAWPMLEVMPIEDKYICEGQEYNDKYFHALTQTGHYEYMIKSQSGCDSALYQIDLHLQPIYEYIHDTTICYGETLDFHGTTLTRSGTYPYIQKYEAGCDSVYETLNLTVLPRINYSVSVIDAMTGPNSGQINLTLAEPTYYYTLNGVINAPLTGLPQGTYEIVVYNQHGCATDPQYLTITTECLGGDIVLPISMICADDLDFIVPFDKEQGLVSSWSLLFSDDAQKAGFKDIVRKQENSTFFLNGVNDLLIELPENVIPGHYQATLVVHDVNCDDLIFPFSFSVFYPSSILTQKWDNVLAVYNSKYNGGYEFSSFRWYRNGELMENEYGSYLHLGETAHFEAGDIWQVGLVRRGETEEVLSCPFYPVVTTPQQTVSVRQLEGYWEVEILDFGDAQVTVYNSMGLVVHSAQMTNDIVQIKMPEIKGVYIVNIYKPDTGEKQAFRLIVE